MNDGMKKFSSANVGPVSSAQAVPADGRSDVWEELVSKHGNHPGHSAVRHASSHTKVDHLVDIGVGVAETLAITTILDTALDVPGSGLNLLGSEMPTGDADDIEGTADFASGVFDSIFKS